MEIMMGRESVDIIAELFESLLQRYERGLEKSMKGNKFVFNNVDLLHYHIQKISLNRGRQYVDSPKWLKNEEATINPKNNDDNCFRYALTAALNYQNIKSHPERVSNLKSFVKRYNRKKMDFSAT